MVADTETSYCGSPIYGARKIRRLHFKNTLGEVLIAGAGNGALGQVLARHLSIHSAPTSRARKPNAMDDWAETVAEAVAGVLADAKPPLTVAHEGGTVLDGALLLGYAGRLWYLFTHMAQPAPDGVAAIGSGSDIAMGAMHTGLAAGAEPLLCATDAVLLACRFAPGVGVDEHGPAVERLG